MAAVRSDVREPVRLRLSTVLVLVVLLAFGVRVAAITLLRPTCDQGRVTGVTGECWELTGDTHYVSVQAQYLAAGDGFIDAGPVVYGTGGPDKPGAAHPPLFTIFLALLDKVGFDSAGWWRLATAFVGSIGVGLIALAAWRLGGDRDGTTGPSSRRLAVIAGVLGALSPLLWARDADLLVESLVIPLIALVVLASLRLWRRPTFGNAAWLGAAIGVAWLARSEMVAILPCMAPLFWGLREQTVRKRVLLFVLSGAIALAAMAPWLLYNSRRFENPVYLSTNLGMAVLLGSCDATYYGADFAYWTFECVNPVDTSSVADESASEKKLSATARGYIGEHKGKALVTMAARTGRFWGIYQPVDTVSRWSHQEGMGNVVARSSFLTLAITVPLAIVGGWQLRRRRVPISPLVAPIVVATVAATVLIPIPRFRVAADVTLLLLATVGVELLWRRLVTDRASRPSDARSSPQPSSA